jgi:hypothetical protein
MWMYYRDVTLYGLTASLLPAIGSSGLYNSFGAWFLIFILIFGVFGTGLGLLGFWYFQKQQYYMYFNLGYTKTHLVLTTWGINLALAILLALFSKIF